MTTEYREISEPTTVYAYTGIVDSNTYIGRSQALGNLYSRLELTAGDEIHSLPGGNFAVLADGSVYMVRLDLDVSHPFERARPSRTPLPGTPTTTPMKVSNYVAGRSLWESVRLTIKEADSQASLLGTSLDWLTLAPLRALATA